MKANYLMLLIGVVIGACSHPKATVEAADPRFPECPSCDLKEKLYYFADTSFTRHDSLFIVNNRLDTTVIETGIFTYLQESYPVTTPGDLVSPVKQGVQAEAVGDSALTTSCYQRAVSFYQDYWLKRKEGFENGGFSDLNDYYAANVNIAILVSYAFEKLSRLPEARAALAPFMANVEAEKSKIQLRYVQLCIQQYGKTATRQALDGSGKTVHHAQSESEYCDWKVTVFGANFGVDFCSDHYASDSLSQREAQRFIRERPFYALVN